jgi:3-phenylpropionate/trans-cinnamate dioxygenase ferredoxin reductase subunit
VVTAFGLDAASVYNWRPQLGELFMSESNAGCIVIGASHAAASFCAQLRNGGWDRAITVVSEESYLPYHRPPLSKAFLSGDKEADAIQIRPADFYEKAQVEFVLGQQAVGIDRNDKYVLLASGDRLPYSKVALTTGAAVRRLRIDGSELDGVHYLRDLADATAIRASVGDNRHAVIIGGGYIGLETAASLLKIGMQVTVVEAMPRILQRVTTPALSAFFTRVHEEEGVRVLTGAQVERLSGGSHVESVHLRDGTELPADLVVVGVGVLPHTELAESAGLEVGNGIVVDEYARTSDHDIVAAGDCTWHFNPIYQRWLRLESVQNATDQARTAANTVNGKLEPYRALPWFWSDQFDLKLQIAGLSEGFDRVVMRGDCEHGRSFAAFYFAGDRLLAIDAVNCPREYMATRKALAAGMTADPAMVGDESVALDGAFREPG